jgi:hypothetical protein
MGNSAEYASAGATALQQGNAQKARELFAMAGTGDATLALDRLLAAEPRNTLALIQRADCYAAAGDARSASAFYQLALRTAPQAGVPRETAQELARARQICDRFAADYRDHLLQRLAASGFDPERSSQRFAQSVDIVLGRKRIYLQEPKYYYFPGLPQLQFYDRSLFPWLDDVEAATDDIRSELLEVMREPESFAPYVQGHANRPHKDQMGMLNNPAWSAFYLWKNGDVVPENAARCPKTLEALRNAPLARVRYRSPSVLFSLLRPGAHIPPHNGLINTRLICHLPLVVPGRCRFRVGNDERQWAEGKAWAFDDTIEHEAWNDSDGTRVILLFDVWRPELTEEERSLVIALFEAIDAHSGKKPEWRFEHDAQFVLAGCLASTAALLQPAAAQDPAARSGMPTRGRRRRRLACYDREVDRITARPAAGVAAAPAAAAEPVTPALTPEERFGRIGAINREEADRRYQESRDLVELNATATEIWTRADGLMVVTLDNGQIWKQVRPDSMFRLKVGEKIRIQPAAMGSFILSGSSKRSTRVARLK